MPAQNHILSLYRRLNDLGLTRAYVKKTALPSWWDDHLAENPAGYAQGLMLISRHLGLDLASLQNENVPVRLRDFGICKFKKREGVSEDDLALSRVLATRTAQLAAAAITHPISHIAVRALAVRQDILDQGHSRIGLRELVDYCWSLGLPVLHLDHFPKNAKRPDGFAARVQGRPVIVLCRKAKYTAWLLFILAHELGHLALGHVPENGSLLDEGIETSSDDAEEREANEFAIELLTGNANTRFTATGRWPNAQALAKDAEAIGRQRMIDPGHIALSYAHSMGNSFFAVGNAALNIIEPHADPVGLVRERLAENLDWSRLPEDSCEFLMRVTKHGSSA